jgi:glyoxylase-like metal-dependent hydrolase (beta-lactamase superfamily II)
MDVSEIVPGLWRWTAFHRDWNHEVGCVYLETEDGVVLVDPLVPTDDREHFWAALDRDVERNGGRVEVLVTVYWHTRSTVEIQARYGARAWAGTTSRAAVARRTKTTIEPFHAGDRLPGGIEAFPTARRAEVVFWLPKQRALVPGDVLIGDAAGGVRMCPESWLPGATGHRELAATLRPLLELPVARILLSHGEPVLRNGRSALAGALDAP